MTVMRAPVMAVALGVCCAVLGWQVYSEANTPIRMAPLAAPAAMGPGRAQPQHLPDMPPIKAFKEIVARPLFVEGRRPVEVEQPVKVEKPQVVNIMLTGIIIGESRKIAHLKEFKKLKVHALQEGDTISEWRVESILEDRVILKAGQQTESLLLYVARPPENAPKRAIIPPRMRAPANVPRRVDQHRRQPVGGRR